MYLEQLIDKCYTLVTNTGSILDGGQVLVELAQYFEDNVDEFLKLEVVVPLSLHESLQQLDKVVDLSTGWAYLERIKQSFQPMTDSFRIYYVLISCLLYLRLVEDKPDRCNMLYAYCFLCFDYGRLEDRLV